MSDRQAPKKRPQIIRAPEIGVILPETYPSTDRYVTLCGGWGNFAPMIQRSFAPTYSVGEVLIDVPW